MTGGMAYLYDPEGSAEAMMNLETIVTCPVTVDHWEGQLRDLVERHAEETGSQRAKAILQDWDIERRHFLQVCPREMLNKLAHPIGVEKAAIPAE